MNITYYGGQIKPEYRGHFAVFLRVQRDIKHPFFFSETPMGTQEYVTRSGINFVFPFPLPFRTYLQVNDKGYNELKNKFKFMWEQDRNSFTVIALDKIIVEEAVVQAQHNTMENFLKYIDAFNFRTAFQS